MRKKVIFWIWTSVCLAIRVILEISARQAGNGEPYIAEILYLTILTFPVGLAVPFVLTAIIGIVPGFQDSILFSNATISTSLTWMLYVGLGYLQWFIFLPKLIFKLKFAVKEKKQIRHKFQTGNFRRVLVPSWRFE